MDKHSLQSDIETNFLTMLSKTWIADCFTNLKLKSTGALQASLQSIVIWSNITKAYSSSKVVDTTRVSIFILLWFTYAMTNLYGSHLWKEELAKRNERKTNSSHKREKDTEKNRTQKKRETKVKTLFCGSTRIKPLLYPDLAKSINFRSLELSQHLWKVDG